MTVLEDISFTSSNKAAGRRISGRKSMLILSDEEDEEDYDTAVGIKSKSKSRSRSRSKSRKKIYVDSDDDEDDSGHGGDNDSDIDSDGYLSPLEHDKENVMNSNNNSNGNSINRKRNNDPKRKNHPDSVKKISKKGNGNGNGNDSKNSKKTPNPKPKKRRRRSSARFLRLSGRFGNNDEDSQEDDGVPEEEQLEKLNDMYSKAIQLNAANKINAVNSWGLNIIDKMDKFLGDDDEGPSSAPIDVEEDDEEDTNTALGRKGDDRNNQKKKRVNFTKASCTIDACVKIYSYRVDDAHLTSYKVLANLNRSDNNGAQKKNSDLGGLNEHDLDDNEKNGNSQSSYAKRRESTAVVKTVETNPANLNISKLDSAYDIDPIFHKLSQKFDEGGAKGLLLVNLGVANDGCRIVLDSKEDSTDSIEPELVDEFIGEDADIDDDEPQKEGMLDISKLVQTLGTTLPSSPMESIHFVPQLEELRHTYALLEEEGFVEAGKAMQVQSFRYANNAEEDKVAEEEIHREALERSTASGIQNRTRTSFMLPNTSLIMHNVSMFGNNLSSQNNSDDYQQDDYGGGNDHDYDDGDDDGFDNFIAMDDHAEKYASDSFRNDPSQDGYTDPIVNTTTPEISGAVTFLDEICAGDALTQSSNFNYFNPDLINKLTSGNQWAGSAHWKKSQTVRPEKAAKKVIEEKKRSNPKQKRKSTKECRKRSLINVNISSRSGCLNALLSKKKTQKGKTTKKDNCSMTKAAKQKCERERNTLPFDAGINANNFTEFFMRPGASISLNQGSETNDSDTKRVGFLGIESESFNDEEDHFDDGVDDSYDGGPGFDLADNSIADNEASNDNYVVQELEGIRKVEKVRVKHASVAKKVDVRRLKKDLWIELERNTDPIVNAENNIDNDDEDIDTDERREDEDDNVVSFKDTVFKLGATEAQEDVSLPFYFICVLHLANEKGLKLENGENGLSDFVISRDLDIAAPTN